MSMTIRTALPEPDVCRSLRNDAGISATQVAAEIGVATSTLHAWEAGKNEPRGLYRSAYLRVLEKLAGRVSSTEPVR